MFGKLLAIILTIGLTAVFLLVIRHQRLEAAHDGANIYRDMLRHEHALWQLRTELAERTTPEEIGRLLESLPVEWRPIPDPTRSTIDLNRVHAPSPGLVNNDAPAEAEHGSSSLAPG